MRRDELLFNIFLGISILSWGIIGLYYWVSEGFSIIRFSSSVLNLCIGFFIIFRNPVVKNGTMLSILISIPSFLFGGIIFKMAHPFNNWPSVLELVFVIGVIFAIVSFSYLGKNIAIFPSLRAISTKGPYRLIRHPCYSSELVLTTCCCVVNFNFLTTAFLLMFLLFLHLRIEREEELLSQSEDFTTYKQKVKWKLIPYIW